MLNIGCVGVDCDLFCSVPISKLFLNPKKIFRKVYLELEFFFWFQKYFAVSLFGFGFVNTLLFIWKKKVWKFQAVCEQSLEILIIFRLFALVFPDVLRAFRRRLTLVGLDPHQ